MLAPPRSPAAELRTFAQYRDELYSIRTPRFKLIRHRAGRISLFDLVADPRERRNLADELPELSANLAAELESWRRARPRLNDDSTSTTELDPATEQRLRTLGYLD